MVLGNSTPLGPTYTVETEGTHESFSTHTRFSWFDRDDPSRCYVSYIYTSIIRCEADGCIEILKSGDLEGKGAFINPYVMDTVDSKVLYTCTTNVYKTMDATAGGLGVFLGLIV